MEITIEWTEEDIDHIRKHNIEPKEVESIFESKIYYRRNKGFYNFYGRAKSGRILLVITKKVDNKYRVITARDATPSEKALYVKRAKGI
ncbi:MAG: BrnT family toxin [Candidatus Hydrothermarchaeota archaeon]|nr:BrnT family toxin [Candidatus Hydrothermarchaeota archaeon]